MLTLSRGGPNVWLSENDAKSVDVADNDWVELYNENGAIMARAIVSQRIPDGVVMMYHAQDKTVNAPMSRKTGVRGGVHNSVTRVTMKPTHMIGGYYQLAYGWNYYGTVGSNRDEFVVLRKVTEKIEWGNTYAANETAYTKE
jgi:nitrate reductase alpha subunit